LDELLSRPRWSRHALREKNGGSIAMELGVMERFILVGMVQVVFRSGYLPACHGKIHHLE
jgi:hypothetical protein